jgi:hypothetical protein
MNKRENTTKATGKIEEDGNRAKSERIRVGWRERPGGGTAAA